MELVQAAMPAEDVRCLRSARAFLASFPAAPSGT
jgi:hypothetical protein